MPSRKDIRAMKALAAKIAYNALQTDEVYEQVFGQDNLELKEQLWKELDYLNYWMVQRFKKFSDSDENPIFW